MKPIFDILTLAIAMIIIVISIAGIAAAAQSILLKQ